MPTATGAETVSERLERLRAELARVRASIARQEDNGAQFATRGTSISQIAYERLIDRERTLAAQVAALEARLAGSAARPGIAVTRTRID